MTSWPKIRWIVLKMKYGSGLLLAAIDILIVALWALDVKALLALDLDYLELVLSEPWTSRFTDGFALANFALLFFVPVVMALGGNFIISKHAPQKYYRYAATSTSRSWVLVAHLGVVLGTVGHLSATPMFARFSGVCGPLGSGSSCFGSFFRDDLVLVLGGGIAVPLLGMLAKDAVFRGRELVKEFRFWWLVGAAGEYQPTYGDEIIYVNTASMAPSIRAIGAETETLHYRYQRAVPTSDRARQFLLRKADRSRRLLESYLMGDNDRLKKAFRIEFFPGTSRALEAGLLRIQGVRRIVLTQYEHPSQAAVAEWLSLTHGLDSCISILPAAPSLFQDQWERQKEVVCGSIIQEVEKSDQRAAVILSEVHYITGFHIPISEVIETVRAQCPDVVFIVDGSQAVGNLERPFISFAEKLGPDDLYYFSAHKWLLSPNTCGVLLSHVRSDERGLAQPYDSFGFELPITTVDPNTIFGLISALEFLFGPDDRFGRLCRISRETKAYFEVLVDRDDSKFEVVSSASSALDASLFVAVQPSLRSKWRFDQEHFWAQMVKRGVDLTVIPEHKPYFSTEEPSNPSMNRDYILRISFPYFLVGKNVRALVRHLNALLEDAN